MSHRLLLFLLTGEIQTCRLVLGIDTVARVDVPLLAKRIAVTVDGHDALRVLGIVFVFCRNQAVWTPTSTTERS